MTDSSDDVVPHEPNRPKAKCRTPDKRVYASKAEADFVRRSQPSLRYGHPYWCKAHKGWHLTSQEQTPRGRHGRASGSLAANERLHELFYEI